LVGEVKGGSSGAYEPVTPQQNLSLKWLVSQLLATLRLKNSQIFHHPEVSRKNPSEASTAQW
jgi:hypothetical protein